MHGWVWSHVSLRSLMRATQEHGLDVIRGGAAGLTAGGFPPPLQGHARGLTRVHIRGECGAHAVFAHLTETRVVHASLGGSSSQNHVSYMIIVMYCYVLCTMYYDITLQIQV